MHDGPIFWHQGLALQPQQFQLADERTLDMLSDTARILRPLAWGVKNLRLNDGALRQGRIEVVALEALFPASGELVRVPENAAVLPPVMPCGMRQGQEFLLVARLAKLPAAGETDRQPETESSEGRTIPVVSRKIPDRYRTAAPVDVETVLAMIRLELIERVSRKESSCQSACTPEGKEPAEAGASLPLALLRRTQSGFEPVPDYAPPCLLIENSPLLHETLRHILSAVFERSRDLAPLRHKTGPGRFSDDPLRFLLLRSLTRYGKLLELACNYPLPPFRCYALLQELLGELSVFSLNYSPLGEDASGHPCIAPYRHDDPAPAFLSLERVILEILGSLHTQTNFLQPFVQEESWLQVAPPPELLDAQAGRRQFWVVLHGAKGSLAKSAQTIGHIKMACGEDLLELAARALPGLAFTHKRAALLPGIPTASDDMLLQLDPSGELWDHVRQTGSLCLFWPDGPEKLEADFAVLDE